ncbi:MAG TPA: TolC family protein [Bacteroidales bacterium]|nr:TolC family protein [Bacteroidales bacterium]HOM40685.1 TolC family protein [Bacteroidales bacterium]
MSVKTITKFLVILISIPLAGQDLNSFLREVAENNPEIIAYRKMLEARKAEARTNLYPSGPEASFGYMPGSGSTAGTKKTWSVSQKFDFPAKYLAMKNISRNTISLAEQEFELGKLNILLEAEITAYDYHFRKRLLALYEKRSNDCSVLLEAWKKKLEEGETTINEYNRIALELSAVRLRKSNIEAEIKSLEQKLLYLAGGKINFPEAIEYPEDLTIEPDSLIKIKLLKHPAFLIPVREYELSFSEMSLGRSSGLPELMAGYSSEILPSETYTGPVIGISIPLWASSGKLKSARARVYQAEASMNSTIEKLKSEIKREYAVMESLKSAINDLKNILKSSGSTAAPEKALLEGEITITEYFALISVIYDTEERLIETENEYCNIVSMINDYTLAERFNGL